MFRLRARAARRSFPSGPPIYRLGPNGELSVSRDRAWASRNARGEARVFDLRLRRHRLVVLLGRSSCLILLLAAVMSGCGGSGDAYDEEKAAPEYAATPRKALESWVNAVRAGDIEMMCRLLGPRPCKKALVETRLLPLVRAEMRGLKGDLHYGAIDIGAPEARIVIGVVSGDSPAAYAVPVARGKTQWSIDDEEALFWGRDVPPPRAVLERPDPSAALASGRTAISFTASAHRPGSNYPNAELWIDSRHVNGRLDGIGDEYRDMEEIRWIGAARLLPGRHVMVAGVKGDGGVSANAWVLTVR